MNEQTEVEGTCLLLLVRCHAIRCLFVVVGACRFIHQWDISVFEMNREAKRKEEEEEEGRINVYRLFDSV